MDDCENTEKIWYSTSIFPHGLLPSIDQGRFFFRGLVDVGTKLVLLIFDVMMSTTILIY